MALPTINKVWDALTIGGFEISVHYQIRGDWKTVDNMDWLEWLSETPKPTEAELLTWWGQYQTEQTNETNVLNAKQTLKSKIQLAKDYATSIQVIFNADLDETINQSIQPNRYNTLSALMELQPNAFKNRFYNDIREEMGLNFPTILATATLAQQRQYCVYLRTWITQIAFLLSLYNTF